VEAESCNTGWLSSCTLEVAVEMPEADNDSVDRRGEKKRLTCEVTSGELDVSC
jgi:hypothetical protein